MKSMWIVVLLALASCKGGSAEKQKKAPATATKPLPGTEGMQKLLDGVGRAAKPNAGTHVALGELFGKGGMLGGGPALGAGVVGASGKPVAADDGTNPATETDEPATPVALPPPASAGGGCAEVAKRIGDVALAKGLAELGNDAEARKLGEPMIRDLVTAMVPQLEQACMQQSWPQQLNDCILTAADADALGDCERHVTPAMRDAAAKAPSAPEIPRPTTPAPVWNGGNDCAAVGAHTAALAEWEVSGAPDAIRASAAELVAQIKPAVEQTCTASGWNDTVRACILGAASLEAVNACGASQ